MGKFNSVLFRRPQFVGGYEPVHEIDNGVYDIDSLHDFLKIVCADGRELIDIDGIELQELLFPFGEALTRCGRDVISERFSETFYRCVPSLDGKITQLRFSGNFEFMKKRWRVDAYYIDDGCWDAETFFDVDVEGMTFRVRFNIWKRGDEDGTV